VESQDENERARLDHLERTRLKHEAYATIFNNPVGKLVLDDIDRFCKRGDESIHMDREGRMDPFTTIYRDGKKAVADRIHAMIDWSGNDNSSSGTE